MIHKNDMTAWASIECQRGHSNHQTRRLNITLGGQTRYTDLTPIPERFRRSFLMDVYDPDIYPVDGGLYCPAHDAVSATLVSHGIWEPRESVLALSVFETTPKDSVFLDLGAQIGWYSLLAASSGLRVNAFDADGENLKVLKSSFRENGWSQLLSTNHVRIGPDTPVLWTLGQVRLAKLDLEGAENHAIRMLWPLISEGKVDFIQMEVSPVFNDTYPQLVWDLIEAGYEAYQLPSKRVPPVVISEPKNDMAWWRLDDTRREDLFSWVANCHQEDLWFRRIDAEW